MRKIASLPEGELCLLERNKANCNTTTIFPQFLLEDSLFILFDSILFALAGSHSTNLL